MKFLNFGDLVKIAVIAYLFVWLANRGLKQFGLGAYQATPDSSS